MTAVPAIPPVTMPVVDPIAAIVVLLLLQVPVVVASVSVVVKPEHTDKVPEMLTGVGLTVTTAEVTQPVDKVYQTVSSPTDTPVTSPVPDIVALGLLMLHVPPPASVSAVVAPTHTVKVPEIAEGNAYTVTTAVVWQPVLSAYVIIVVPAVPPVTIPVVDPIVATIVLLLLQVPVAVASVNVVVSPEHTDNVPEMLAGDALTVTTDVVTQPLASV